MACQLLHVAFWIILEYKPHHLTSNHACIDSIDCSTPPAMSQDIKLLFSSTDCLGTAIFCRKYQQSFYLKIKYTFLDTVSFCLATLLAGGPLAGLIINQPPFFSEIQFTFLYEYDRYSLIWN